MDTGWTGKTCLKNPAKLQDLFKHDLVPFLVGQATRVRRENATEYWAESTAQMMIMVRA